jgi:phenylacetate-coenzyme A ligase PaaK-like adenylate-forming protein
MSDTFIYGEIRIHPSVFRAVLEAHPTIYQYQVRQTANGADLVVQGTADTERIAHEVAESLASHGLASPDVSVVCAGNIARLQTGRIQRFIPLTSRADDPK